ncbi:MAG: 16S rRNA (guanine(966)-N(2))-methyltransferase RsmD [Candidatus Omnitrophica bacterium]|jgi:16S rRNA (guanine(966)-N(2))-methyltransferase RsmD|nr:16S rRNA (guanine(966)-N(2))-methyltransferase RsmD [Candidatus Omnitrophota bacterium]
MRVILGSLKGRAIKVPSGIRPVSNRVKKACFDILKDVIGDKRVLELFAGSGALGIEALSQGAKEAVFVDVKPECVRAIKENIFSLGISEKANVHLKDTASAINDFYVYKEKFDLIFLDPPYHEAKLINTLQNLEDYDILTPSGYIVCLCYIKDEYVKNSGKFSVILEKKYGQTLLLVYARKEA